MSGRGILRRSGAIALVLGLGLALAACLLSPGKFTSTLDLRRDGRFAFAYTGEVSMFGLAQLAAMGKQQGQQVFEPQPCYGLDETGQVPDDAAAAAASAAADPAVNGDEDADARECTPAEVATQKSDWERQRKETAERERKDLENLKAVLGGLDPTDPKSVEEFAARLRRQAGWKAVTYRGEGLFEVDFAISGRLDHDFVFPIIEKFPTANTFVQVLRRNDGTVRIDAPGFMVSQGDNPMLGMMGMGMMGRMGGGEGMGDATMPKMPQLDGSFVLTTDGQILANNTDEGPTPGPGGQMLAWAVSVRTAAAPTALVRLDIK